jgi:hypothetical protein
MPPVDLVLTLIPRHVSAPQVLREALGQGVASVSALAALRTWLPARLAHALLELEGIATRARLESLAPVRRDALLRHASELRLTVTGTPSVEEATVTVGGILREEIDPVSLASRRVSGLFLAGEVIDVAGDTGGYNLEWALASGYIAGESAARWAMSAGDR